MPVEQLLPLLFSGLIVILTIAILSTLAKVRAAVEELAVRPVVAPAPQPVNDGTDEIYAVIMATISEDLQIPLDQLQFDSIRECQHKKASVVSKGLCCGRRDRL